MLPLRIQICLYMKVKDVIRLLEKDGWHLIRVKGSHHHFKHPEKENLITVPDHGRNDDLAKGTAHKIMKDAGLK